jgi:hypothetical protein
MPNSTTGVDSVRAARGKTHGSKKECYSRRHGKGGKTIQQENKNTHQKVFYEAKHIRQSQEQTNPLKERQEQRSMLHQRCLSMGSEN